MTIELLGTIAEIVAAAATLATLLYLAYQIRASVAATQAEARRASAAAASDVLLLLVGDSEFADIFMRGLANSDSLSAPEAFRFRLGIACFYSSLETTWKEVQLGTTTDDSALEIFNSSRPFFLTPGGRAWWTENRETFSVDFQEFYDSCVREYETR